MTAVLPRCAAVAVIMFAIALVSASPDAHAKEPDAFMLADGSRCRIASERSKVYGFYEMCGIAGTTYANADPGEQCGAAAAPFLPLIAEFNGDDQSVESRSGCLDEGTQVGLGWHDVREPYDCQVIGDANDTGLQCVNVYYGSGFALKHQTYQLFQPHTILDGLELATCKEGYVWREARTSPIVDHLCVTPATQHRTRQENVDAPGNWQQGTSGRHTCKNGLVWRQAFLFDDVCVTQASRDEADADFAAARSRRKFDIPPLI